MIENVYPQSNCGFEHKQISIHLNILTILYFTVLNSYLQLATFICYSATDNFFF